MGNALISGAINKIITIALSENDGPQSIESRVYSRELPPFPDLIPRYKKKIHIPWKGQSRLIIGNKRGKKKERKEREIDEF